MQKRTRFSSGAAWENIVGYSRAVKTGDVIEISGTTAVDGDRVIGHDVYEQAVYIFRKIEKTLKEAGSCMEDVVRTRMFVTNIQQWQEVGKAHALFFKNIKPATTMVEVSNLIDKRLLVEIEATAIIAGK